MKTAVYLLAFLLVGIGIGVLVPLTQTFLDSRREAQRWQDCAQYHDLPITIGGRRLTLPALDNAHVWMLAPKDNAEGIETEAIPDAEPGTPLVFCVPPVMGPPPYNVGSVSLHGDEQSRNSTVDPGADLAVTLSKFGPV